MKIIYSVKTHREDLGDSKVVNVIESGIGWGLEIERNASCAVKEHSEDFRIILNTMGLLSKSSRELYHDLICPCCANYEL